MDDRSSGARIPVRRCFLDDSPVLFAGCDTAPDMPFRFIFVQHLLDLEVKRLCLLYTSDAADE